MANSGGVKPGPGKPVTPIAKKQAKERKQRQRQKQAKRQANRAAYDPFSPLSGKLLKRVSRALTELELRPGINAQKAAIEASKRGQEYDTSALDRMGDRLDTQMSGLASRMGDYRDEAVSRAEAARDRMNEGLASTARESTDRLNSLQGEVLGSQISALSDAGIQPGQSATDQAMGQIAQGQQDALSRQRESWQGLASVMGEQGVTTAGAMGDAAQYGVQSDRGAIQRNIASRVADRRQMGAEERSAAQEQLATLRGLRGSTRLKNLLELRREQQDYGARMSEIEAQRQQWNKENELDWFNAQSSRIRANKSGSSGGSGGSSDTPRKMTGPEWKDWKSVGREIVESNPGKKITNWSAFLDAVASTEGVSWKPRERAQFKRRFQKWYNQNY